MASATEILHQILAIAPVTLNRGAMGLGYGWVAPTLENLRQPNSEIPIDTVQSSWIGSTHELGRTLGALCSIVSLDLLGRKSVLLLSALIFFVQWPFIMYTKNVAIICAIRIIFGFGIGLNDVVASIYLAENSSTKLRGIFGSLIVAQFYGGRLLEFVIVTYFSYYDAARINAIISLFTFLSALLLKESPQFLLMQGKHAEAYKNYVWLRGKETEEVRSEFASIKENVEEEQQKRKSIKKLFNSPNNRRSFKIILALCILTILTGSTAIASYSSISFSSSEVFTPNEFTILFGLAQFVACCMSPLFIERFDRRSIMSLFFCLSAVSHSCTAGLYYVHNNIAEVPYFPYLIFISITAYMSLFAMGILPAFFMIRGELFPQSIKVFGGCVAVFANSLTGTLTCHTFLVVKEYFGIYMNFLLFAIFSLVTTLFVHCAIPETRGRTLIQIQKELANEDCKKSVTA